ncbi:MAG: metal-sensitive transcriptional regulator [Deltaproteobacteria bacterium]|nr:metal-sensitive transcriptional regulator [Deltaproteobacteria bacterium]
MRQIFPDHESQLTRLGKIEGQLKGVRKMIEERRYCIEIISQIKAVQGALKQVEMGVLENHIHHCVKEAVRGKDQDTLEKKLEEVVKAFEKM